ncbi:MAG: tetratricopeptide repeat protein [Elusimicrobiota bacterium]
MKKKAAAAAGLFFPMTLFFSGCRAVHYYCGRLLEERGSDIQAARQYADYLDENASGLYAGSVHVRLGNIDAAFGRCPEARRHYETALRFFNLKAALKAQAFLGLMDCPNYFPLNPESWSYGDSATLGKNMRLDWSTRVGTAPASAQILSSLYAGKNLIRKSTQSYFKRDWAVWQRDGKIDIPILKYPYSPGRKWEIRSPSGVYIYEIVSNDAKARTAAGAFPHCLKVRETNEKFPGSWEYVYYAPGIGRVKTTIGGPGYENPNIELLHFSVRNGSGTQFPIIN